MEPLRITNPATGDLLEEVAGGRRRRGDRPPSARARAAQPAWGALPFAERGRVLRRLARALRDDATFLDTLMSESGKPRYEAEGIELFYTLELTRYYTGRAGRRALADELRGPMVFAEQAGARRPAPARRGRRSSGRGTGRCSTTTPTASRPLAAGNAVVLKPSEHTPLTSLRIAERGPDDGRARRCVPGGGGTAATPARR